MTSETTPPEAPLPELLTPGLLTPGPLVTSEWLEAHLDHPDLRIVDASWYLPDEGRDAAAEYAAAHLPGAVRLDLSSDLAVTDAPVRNTILPPADLARVFGAAGIGTRHAVVVYDRKGGFSAGRVWWALRYAGHSGASLLDGGFVRWQDEGRPTTDEVAAWPTAEFQGAPRPRSLALRQDVLRAIDDEGAQIVDARSPARFRGEEKEHTRHRGRIPGSLNVPWSRSLDPASGGFHDPEALRRVYREAGVDLDKRVITTCGSGVTAALDAFALTLLGCEDVAVYDGSWAEWGDRDDTPKEPS
ncbi:MAG: sulfurtransferase [Deltaproteobacteria bacterium]|nr:sulfurtransferase [Deltaproteobacteria bacterium]